MSRPKSLVYGVGVNDACYKVQGSLGGHKVTCQFYTKWSDMLKRCYSERLQSLFPTYKGCSVCEEWLLFSNFKAWMEQQDWKGNQLDKDLLVQGNKVYSPDNCVFIHSKLNSLLLDRAAKRGCFPLGVYKNTSREDFRSQAVSEGKQKYLGTFSTPEEAHKVWQQTKKDLIYFTAMEQTNERLRNALLLRCDQLQHDIDNGLETIKL